MIMGNIVLINVINTILFALYINYSNKRMTNDRSIISYMEYGRIIIIIIVSAFLGYIKNKMNYLIYIFCNIFVIGVLLSKNNLHKSLLVTVISTGINYVINIGIIVVLYSFHIVDIVKNEYVVILLINAIHIICLTLIFNLRKFKHGLSFLNYNNKGEYEDVLILNISMILIFIITLILTLDLNSLRNIAVILIIFSMTMIVLIYKSIQLYYKQKLLIQDLNETKKDLEIKTKEVQTLEQENLSYSKKAHSLEHKLKSLENKINKLTYNQEISKEIGIDKQIKDISNQIHNQIVYVELDKTGIEEIDDMLDTMRNEAIKNNIEFNLQLKGNIYQMTNNYIDKQDLAILLADHIKDAIIAINHTENINKSILVRLGKIDNCFALYIYDTGVEFKKEVLDNLGKIPITTYKEEGGTGMGFMNTFDTLSKTNASLTIKQIGPPSKDNYTKVIMITFDGKHEFKII